MQMEKAARLRRLWKAKGNPPCTHSHLDKEYYLGADTGDYVCTTCGEAGFGSDWPEKEKKNKNP